MPLQPRSMPDNVSATKLSQGTARLRWSSALLLGAPLELRAGRPPHILFMPLQGVHPPPEAGEHAAFDDFWRAGRVHEQLEDHTERLPFECSLGKTALDVL